MIKLDENKIIFKQKIYQIFNRYNIDVNNNMYHYNKLIDSCIYISDDPENEENEFKYRDYKGIEYIGLFFKSSTNNYLMYRCKTCGKYFLTAHIHTPLDFNLERSCKNCSNGIKRQKYYFIPLEHRDKFLSMVWNMHSRCYNINHPRYNSYGERGIEICNEWRMFFLPQKLNLEILQNKMKHFYYYCISLGWAPNKEIDRIDVDKNYEPGNIRFVNMRENLNNRQNNTFYELRGLSKTIAGWSRFTNIDINYIRNIFYKYNNNILSIYQNDLLFKNNFNKAYKEYIENNIDKDRDSIIVKNTRFSVSKILIYRNIQTSKSNWARAIGINLSTFDSLFRKYNNDFNILFKNRPDIKEKIDKAIDSGEIYKILQNNKGYKSLNFLGLTSVTEGWARLLNFELSSSLSTMITRRGTLERIFLERMDIRERLINNIKNGYLNKYEDIYRLFSYQGIPIQNNLFDSESYLKIIKQYFYLDKINIFPTILKLALNLGYQIFNSDLNYIYKSSFKITYNKYLNQNNLIKSSNDNREYILCK